MTLSKALVRAPKLGPQIKAHQVQKKLNLSLKEVNMTMRILKAMLLAG